MSCCAQYRAGYACGHTQSVSGVPVKLGPNANGDDLSLLYERVIPMSMNSHLERTKCPRRPHRQDNVGSFRIGVVSNFDSRDLRPLAEMTANCAGVTPKHNECSWTFINGFGNTKVRSDSFACCGNGNALDFHREYPLSVLNIDRSRVKMWGQMLLSISSDEESEKIVEEIRSKFKELRRQLPSHQPSTYVSTGFTRTPLMGFKVNQEGRCKTAPVVISEGNQGSMPTSEFFDFDRYNGVKK